MSIISTTGTRSCCRTLQGNGSTPRLRPVSAECRLRRTDGANALWAGSRLQCGFTAHKRPSAATNAYSSGGGGAEGNEAQELPFPSIPHPDYDAERPQEQTAPEPDNPLPEGLPPNHLGEEEGPKGPEPEVPVPRRSEPDIAPSFPPDIVPMPGPPEAPQRGPPVELPGSPAPPEFQPSRTPSGMPDRGGNEITFPS